MILEPNYFITPPFWKRWWLRYRLQKLMATKAFKLFEGRWPDKLYFYSPRLKRKPRFTGSAEELSRWQERHLCETICPTRAITLKASAIEIDDRKCISCGLCVEFSPPGLLEFPPQTSVINRS